MRTIKTQGGNFVNVARITTLYRAMSTGYEVCASMTGVRYLCLGSYPDKETARKVLEELNLWLTEPHAIAATGTQTFIMPQP